MNTVITVSLELLLLQGCLLMFLAAATGWKIRGSIREIFQWQNHILTAKLFKYIKKALVLIYLILEEYVARKGRRPVSHAFQFSFIIWAKSFGYGDYYNSVKEFNKNSTLRETLKSPVEKYNLTTMDRFIQRVGDDGFKQIMIIYVKECV